MNISLILHENQELKPGSNKRNKKVPTFVFFSHKDNDIYSR